MTFPSKVDRWLIVILVAVMAISLGGVASTVLAGGSPAGLLLAAAIEALVAAFIIWTFRTTRYTVGEHELTIQSGPFRWRIGLADIQEILPSTNPLSSPALSLDRLLVRYGRRRMILISPEDRAGFLAAVAARSPGLVVEGESARRR